VVDAALAQRQKKILRHDLNWRVENLPDLCVRCARGKSQEALDDFRLAPDVDELSVGLRVRHKVSDGWDLARALGERKGLLFVGRVAADRVLYEAKLEGRRFPDTVKDEREWQHEVLWFALIEHLHKGAVGLCVQSDVTVKTVAEVAKLLEDLVVAEVRVHLSESTCKVADLPLQCRVFVGRLLPQDLGVTKLVSFEGTQSDAGLAGVLAGVVQGQVQDQTCHVAFIDILEVLQSHDQLLVVEANMVAEIQ